MRTSDQEFKMYERVSLTNDFPPLNFKSNLPFLVKSELLNGDLTILEETDGSKVIINELLILLTSNSGDFYRNIERGGMFDDGFKSIILDRSGEDFVKSFILEILERDMPNIQVLDLVVTAEPEKRAWYLKLVVMDELTGIAAKFESPISVD